PPDPPTPLVGLPGYHPRPAAARLGAMENHSVLIVGGGVTVLSLADRVEALGGTLEVDSPPARGRRCGRCCRAASSRRRLGAAPRGPGPGARGRRFRGAGAGR